MRSKHVMFFVLAIIIPVVLIYSRTPDVSAERRACYLAIIIDDFGNNTEATNKFINAEFKFTGAVMPNMPYTALESVALKENGKGVILHMPMEAHNAKTSWMPQGAITTDLTDEQIRENIEAAISQIYGISGINNHMGSLAMEDERIVNILADTASSHRLMLIDSKTTAKSLAKAAADELLLKFYERDIFLDGTKDRFTIERNLMKAANIAQKYGFAIAIGHVGSAGGRPTYDAIMNKLAELEQMNVVLVTMEEFDTILSFEHSLE